MKKQFTTKVRHLGLKIMGMLFALLLFSGQSWGQVNILTEDFSSITTGNSTSTSGSSTAWAGNTNFPTVTAAYQAGGAVKLGTSSAIGSITSKILDLSVNGGSFKVSFKVKGWTTVEGNIKITATGLTAQTVTYTAVIAGSFESKEVTFTGGTSNSTIKIETTAKRAFIDDVVIYYNATSIPVVSAASPIGTVGTAFTYNISATNSPTSYAISSGTLPAGLSLNTTSGAITGTPTTFGSSTVAQFNKRYNP